MIHIIGFSIATLALLVWQSKKLSFLKNGVFPILIASGLLLAGYGLYDATMSVDKKFLFMIVDLIGLGVFSTVFEKISWKYRNNSTLPIAVVLALFGLFVYQNIFQKNQFHHPTNLAPEAELLIEIKEGVSIDHINGVMKAYDLEVQSAFTMKDSEVTDLDDYYTVNIPNKNLDEYESIIEDLQTTGIVEWIEGNEIIQVAPVTPERKIGDVKKKYGVNDPSVKEQWGFGVMEVDRFYNYLSKNKITPKKKAVIAILDTGVDAKHEDISANYKSINSKYDSDQQGHGTHCAGIAAAVTNNGKGVASLTWNNEFTTVTSVQVLDKNGMGTQQKIINGILEATDNNADVISMSLGGRSNQRSQRAYQKAVDYATKKGVIIVAAAGNSNRSAKEFAPVNTKGVIGVSAVDQELNRAAFSNYVTDIPMGVAAPGVGIFSTLPGDKYAALSGTSMATPYVAGLLGIMKSIRPGLTAQEAYDILKSSGKETKNTTQTGRLIQPMAAIKSVVESR